jgi:hypothetical protein
MGAALSENFAFVMNVSRLRDAESFTLAPGHELRRATAAEVKTIKDCIGTLHPQSPFINPWEFRLPYEGSLQLLPETEWRYCVIAFHGANSTLAELEIVFDVAPLEFEVGITFMRGPMIGLPTQHGYAWAPSRLFHVLESARFNSTFFVEVSEGDIQEFQRIHTLLCQHDSAIENLKRVLVQLSHLKALPHSSPLRFLGYFALLESLLTHPPMPSDPYDSITRQVKQKIALLENRWTRKLDYDPFAGARADTIWKKMYAYRSLLAHGGATDFAGELAILKNHGTALTLVKDTVKSVIRQALEEPQLLKDLRDC